MTIRKLWRLLLLALPVWWSIALPARAACLATPGSSSVAIPVTTFLASYRVDFRAPTRLAVDAAGRVYIADPLAGDVVVRASDGSIVTWRRGLGSPVSIAVDSGGRIHLGDGLAGRVSVFDGAWTHLFDLGTGAGEFGYPGDISVDPLSGNIYVADTRNHRVRVFNSAGTSINTIGAPGSADGDFQVPTGIFFDPVANELWVMDQLNYRLQAFAPDGTFKFCLGQFSTTSFPPASGGPSRTFGLGQGLWVDAAGRLFVADAFKSQVQVLDRNGFQLATIGSLGQQAGELSVPMDVVIDPAGRLFVASANNARIEIFGIDAYTNPEAIAPALVTLLPASVNVALAGATVTIQVRIAGYSAANVDAASIRVNGLVPTSISSADVDGDGVPELLLGVDATLLSVVPGLVGVTVNGQIGALGFQGSAQLTVSSVAAIDADGDGVDDVADLCPATPAATPAAPDGCSALQRCPCAGPAPGTPWPNHGAFRDCRQNAIAFLMATGRYDLTTATLFIEGANSSHCGAPEGTR